MQRIAGIEKDLSAMLKKVRKLFPYAECLAVNFYPNYEEKVHVYEFSTCPTPGVKVEPNFIIRYHVDSKLFCTDSCYRFSNMYFRKLKDLRKCIDSEDDGYVGHELRLDIVSAEDGLIVEGVK